jgi:hypothetical protein
MIAERIAVRLPSSLLLGSACAMSLQSVLAGSFPAERLMWHVAIVLKTDEKCFVTLLAIALRHALSAAV